MILILFYAYSTYSNNINKLLQKASIVELVERPLRKTVFRICVHYDRVSEPACFGAAPALGIFIRSRLRLLVKENINLESPGT